MLNITHEELISEWENDSKIDEKLLDKSIIDSSSLHSKYLSILLRLKSQQIYYAAKLESLKKEKELYYSGQADPQVYKTKPFHLQLKTRESITKHVNSDPEVLKVQEKYEYQDVLIKGVELIMKEITQRSFHIRALIDWKKFQAGF